MSDKVETMNPGMDALRLAAAIKRNGKSMVQISCELPGCDLGSVFDSEDHAARVGFRWDDAEFTLVDTPNGDQIRCSAHRNIP